MRVDTLLEHRPVHPSLIRAFRALPLALLAAVTAYLSLPVGPSSPSASVGEQVQTVNSVGRFQYKPAKYVYENEVVIKRIRWKRWGERRAIGKGVVFGQDVVLRFRVPQPCGRHGLVFKKRSARFSEAGEFSGGYFEKYCRK